MRLGSSLIAAVVLLVFVDRKLRETEIQQIRRIPKTLGVRTLLAVSPRHRQLHLYTRAFLAALDIPLMSKVSPADLQELIRKGETGFVLLGGRGSGKTTRLQLLAAHGQMSFWKPQRRRPRYCFRCTAGYRIDRWRMQSLSTSTVSRRYGTEASGGPCWKGRPS